MQPKFSETTAKIHLEIQDLLRKERDLCDSRIKAARDSIPQRIRQYLNERRTYRTVLIGAVVMSAATVCIFAYTGHIIITNIQDPDRCETSANLSCGTEILVLGFGMIVSLLFTWVLIVLAVNFYRDGRRFW